jgi:ABC-type antimicrobial peptide transport system permease subunit
LVGGLANSIFQGSILIAEKAFETHFPSVSGARVFLVDAPAEQQQGLARRLSLALQDVGLEVQAAGARLTEFQRVENTYLAIFMALGGLGLVIGSIGMGLVVLRNVMERRGELALLRAVGFTRWAVRRLLVTEHWLLMLLGLVCGTVSAMLAVLPAMAAPGGHVPVGSLLAVLAGVVVSGGIWTLAATTGATQGSLLSALRQE